MATLKPVEAAKAAEICYKAKSNPELICKEVKLVSGLERNFDFNSINKFNSRSGAFFKVKSGFGFLVKGSGNEYNNDYLVSIRGTASLADGLTDANIGLQISSTGKVVHAGFNRAFKDIERHLSDHLPSGSNVHFCGHSLGGALATLAADWAVLKKGCNAKLYTFGSPRVGFKPFCDRFTNSVKSENIFRVHRSTDVVPMIPIWPFTHVPQPGNTCKLANEGFYSPLGAHSITNYAESVNGLTWKMLKTPDSAIDAEKSAVNIMSLGGLKTIGTSTLSLIGKAIAYILKAAGIVVQGGLIVGCTALDLLSHLLEKAVNFSEQVASWTKMLIEKIASLVGITIKKGISFTASFIRWVFLQMMSAVRRVLNFAMLGA